MGAQPSASYRQLPSRPSCQDVTEVAPSRFPVAVFVVFAVAALVTWVGGIFSGGLMPSVVSR